MGRLTLAIVTVAGAAVIGLAHPASAIAAKEINVRCGVYLGGLVKRDSAGSWYAARMGAKRGHPAGGMHCAGRFAVRSGRAGKGVVSWVSHDWGDWNTHFDLLVKAVGGFATGTACAEAASAFIATVGTDGLAWPSLFTTGAAAGCATGSIELLRELPGSENTGNPGVGLIR